MSATPFRLKAYVPSEADTQSYFFEWIDRVGLRQYPELRWLHAIPNGGARDVVTGAQLKRQGVRRGILDTFLPVARSGHHGLYIEFKRPGQKMTPDQEEFFEFAMIQGYSAHVVFDWQGAVDIVKGYLDGAPVEGALRDVEGEAA